MKIVDCIMQERAAQDRQWGGPEHDDNHLEDDWFHFIMKQTVRGLYLRAVDKLSARACLVKIAALALAGIQSIDRKKLHKPLSIPEMQATIADDVKWLTEPKS